MYVSSIHNEHFCLNKGVIILLHVFIFFVDVIYFNGFRDFGSISILFGASWHLIIILPNKYGHGLAQE